MGRPPRGVTVTGDVYVNGRRAQASSRAAAVAYMPQEDLHMGSLTVRETLEFAAKLRCAPRSCRSAAMQPLHVFRSDEIENWNWHHSVPATMSPCGCRLYVRPLSTLPPPTGM